MAVFPNTCCHEPKFRYQSPFRRAAQGPLRGRVPPDLPAALELDRQLQTGEHFRLAMDYLRYGRVYLPPTVSEAGFRRGLNTVPEHKAGKITWAAWLESTYGGRTAFEAAEDQTSGEEAPA